MNNEDLEAPMSEPVADVLALTYMGSMGLSPGTRDALNIRVRSVAGLNTETALRRRIAECLHWHTLQKVPVTNAFVNRVFGKTARRFGTETSLILNHFCRSGRIQRFEPPQSRTGKNLYVAVEPYLQILEAARESGMEADEEVAMLRQWLAFTL